MIKSKVKYLFIFLFINFGGLGFGSWLMNDGPITEWYLNLIKAPWTPPGWVFGLAWTSIMIFFSIYLIYFFRNNYSIRKFWLYIIQVILNVSWNYVFFNQHQILLSLFIIILLTIIIFYLFFAFLKEQKKMSFLLLPYMIWLCIATSLNLYILIYN